jgi:hypothetical protein
MEADTPVKHPEPNSSRRPNRFNSQVVGSLLISIACGLVYPIVGPSRPFWVALGILFVAASSLALARFFRETKRR